MADLIAPAEPRSLTRMMELSHGVVLKKSFENVPTDAEVVIVCTSAEALEHDKFELHWACAVVAGEPSDGKAKLNIYKTENVVDVEDGVPFLQREVIPLASASDPFSAFKESHVRALMDEAQKFTREDADNVERFPTLSTARLYKPKPRREIVLGSTGFTPVKKAPRVELGPSADAYAPSERVYTTEVREPGRHGVGQNSGALTEEGLALSSAHS